MTLSLVYLAASSGVGQAIADEAKSPPPMEELGKFVGDGTCTGRIVGMGKSPGYPTTGRYHGEKILDGQWVAIHYDEDKTDVNPKPFHVQQFVSYDPKRKMFVAVSLDNTGPEYNPATSPGWKGDTFTLEYTATIDGKTVSLRDVFTHNATENSHTGMMRGQNGDWVETDKETCNST